MTKTVESHILTFSNLLSIAVNGAHVKMADLRRWANGRTFIKSTNLGHIATVWVAVYVL